MKTKPLTAVQIDALAQRLFETPVVASIHVGSGPIELALAA